MAASTGNPFPSPLVSPNELHAALSNPAANPRRIIPIAAGRPSSLPSLEAHHIPGSLLFDMDLISDTTSPYPQMLPSAAHFASCMAMLGIHPDDILVVYDTLEVGFYSSPRVAWTCRHFGQRDVHVLNSFPRYVKDGFPVATGAFSALPPSQESYPVREPLHPKEVISFEELRGLYLEHQPPSQTKYQIIDARISGRFSGKEPEANPVLRSGHMPSALNVPLASLLGPDKVVLSGGELRELFDHAGVHNTLPAVLTCNSGVTAAALELALRVSGYTMEKRVYDGSWMEWTRRVGDEGLISVD